MYNIVNEGEGINNFNWRKRIIKVEYYKIMNLYFEAKINSLVDILSSYREMVNDTAFSLSIVSIENDLEYQYKTYRINHKYSLDSLEDYYSILSDYKKICSGYISNLKSISCKQTNKDFCIELISSFSSELDSFSSFLSNTRFIEIIIRSTK